MKYFSAILRAVVITALFLFSCEASHASSAYDSKVKIVAKPSVDKSDSLQITKPDFAYPKTVEKNASASLTANLARKNYPQALNSLIRIVVARQLISESSVKECLNTCDSVANVMPAPYSGIARLLEARILKEMYDADRYKYSERTLPADSVPENPFFWSGEMFRDKIISLVIDCCASMPEADMHISKISDCLRDWQEAALVKLTVADFMRMQAVECLMPFFSKWGVDSRVIPFSPLSLSAGEKDESAFGLADRLAGELYDSGVSSGNNARRAFIDVWLASCLNAKGVSPVDFILSELDSMPNDPDAISLAFSLPDYSYQLLWGSDFPSKEEKELPSCTPDLPLRCFGHSFERFPAPTRKEFYELLVSAKEKLSGLDSLRVVKRIDNLLDILSVGEARLYTWDAYLPDNPILMNVRIANMPEAYIHVYAIPELKQFENFTFRDMRKEGKPVMVKSIISEESIPFSDVSAVSLPALPPGYYAAVILPIKEVDISDTSSRSKIRESGDLETCRFTVSSLSVINFVENKDWKDYSNTAVVVDAASGAPVRDASVSVRATRIDWNKMEEIATGSTDKDGFFCYAKKNLFAYDSNWEDIEIKASKGESETTSRERIPGVSKDHYRDQTISVFTDLSLVHPGDTVKFAAVYFSTDNNTRSVNPGRRIDFRLMNPAGEVKDTLSLVTDSDGRVIGRFVIPDEALLGGWRIHADLSDRSYIRRRNSGTAVIQVAEYKSPSFFVSARKGMPEGDVETPGNIVFSGIVSTFSGMPLAGVKVDYVIDWSPFWWRSAQDKASYGGEVTTGPDGRYVITLPLAGLEGTRFENGNFSFRATAVSSSGETQESDMVYFSLGGGLAVSPEIGDWICVESEAVDFHVPVRDAMGLPVKKNVEWKLYDAKGKVLKEGTFLSPSLSIPSAALPSGSYKLSFHIEGYPEHCLGNGDAESSFGIWRKNDKQPAVETSLWVEDTMIYAGAGDKTVKFRVGSSYKDSHILAIIMGSDGKVQTRWLRPGKGFEWVEVPVPSAENRTRVSLYTIHALKAFSTAVEIVPHAQCVEMKIEAESFRDKITPDSRENWKFRLSMDGRPVAGAAAIAALTDKALDAICPSEWHLSKNFGHWDYPVSFRWLNRSTLSTYFIAPSKYTDEWELSFPTFNTFGQNLFYVPPRLYGSAGYRRSDKAAVVGAVALENYDYADGASYKKSGAVNSESFTVIQESVEEAAPDNGASEPNEVNLRPVEMPLAFFKPSLTSDEEGIVNVDFDVPDFNTTWKFRMIAYDNDVNSAQVTLNTVAARSVMVRSNPPAFLRYGDGAVISALLFNNSEGNLSIGGMIELFDPVTGEVILSQVFAPEELAPSASRAVSVDWRVPDDRTIVGLRFYASGGGFTDGEQMLVAILPSSSQVIESTPFWMPHSEKSLAVRLPDMKEGDAVSLQYCANPMWYAVTSLPVISGDLPHNALSLSSGLFSGCVAYGLVEKYPAIADAIKCISESDKDENSLLNPMLERNPQLKIIKLALTPWTVDAAEERLRLSQLSSLTDSELCNARISAMINALTALQNEDGGFQWTLSLKESSSFVTERVLFDFALMKAVECVEFTPEMNRMCDAAIDFLDNYYVAEKKKCGKLFDAGSMRHYLYIRSFFNRKDNKVSGFADLKKLELAAVKRAWKKYDIYDKSEAAILLFRNNMPTEAKSIVRSLDEFSSSSPVKGVWFDNERNGWSPYSTLLTVSSVLRAFLEISPESPLVQGLGQWLLLSRQTIDWGRDGRMPDVVASLLKAEPKWLGSSSSVEIKIGDKPIEIGKTERFTGEFTVELDPSEISGKTLYISRDGETPAWGGVISRFTQRMKDVKEVSIEDLSVVKQVVSIKDGSEGSKAYAGDLKVGDRVRVTISVHCGRDMQYVVINDERAACLRPVEQLSGYTSSGGVWFDRQQRESTTDLLIPYLPKGDFVISYDCFVERSGVYSSGIVTVQSQLAPVMVAHSAGEELIVYP